MPKKTKQTRDLINALDSSPKPTSKYSSKSPSKSTPKSNPKKSQDFCKDFCKDIILERINCALLPQAFTKIGTDKMGAKIMQKKGQIFIFLLQNLNLPALHILKQEALSAGGDLATPKEAILGEKKSYSAALIATCTQLEKLIYKCKIQPFGLKKIAQKLESHLANNVKTFPKIIMPIINITPDSFYANSRHSTSQAIKTIISLIESGATLIDIGAASTRPGSELIKPSEEKKRLKEICAFIDKENLAKRVDFSIDTYNPSVADFALSSGFVMINDVSGLNNKKMFEVIKHYNAQVVLMHARGTPKDMASHTHYQHLLSEIDEFFSRKIDELEKANASRIVLDIGFGFAKSHAQNLALIQNLAHFKHFGFEILIGASRKSSIGEITGRQNPSERLSGSLAISLLALQNGADIIRTHDFSEHIDMLKIFSAFYDGQAFVD
ncbi:dihydropteroate synthase [Helicobacter sp. T3_23-1059]